MNRIAIKNKANRERSKSGLYILMCNEEIVYIGKSTNIYLRLLEHLVEEEKEFDDFKVVTNENYLFVEILEPLLIKEFNPKYNKLVINSEFEYLSTLPSFVFKEKSRDDYIEDKMHVKNIILGIKNEDTLDIPDIF